MPKLPSLINIPKMYRPLYYYIVQGGTFLEYTMHSNSRQVNLTQTHKLCSKSWMNTLQARLMKQWNDSISTKETKQWMKMLIVMSLA